MTVRTVLLSRDSKLAERSESRTVSSFLTFNYGETNEREQPASGVPPMQWD